MKLSRNEFLIEFWVNDRPRHSFNSQVLSYSFVPRVGDYINANYYHENNRMSGVFEVTRVYIHQTEDRIDAQVHVDSD